MAKEQGRQSEDSAAGRPRRGRAARGRREDGGRHPAAGHRQAEAAARPRRWPSAPASCSDNGERARPGRRQVGDEVLYGRYGGNDVEVDGKEIKILRESDILAKVVK